MKKIALSFSILATVALFTFSCKKDKNVAPEPDKELQSSIDVSYALLTLSDIDVLTGFIGQNQLYPQFYLPTAFSTGTIVSSRDTTNKYVNIGFNKTACVDGKVRDGSIFMNYDSQTAKNRGYYYDFGYRAKITLSNYIVDGWEINTSNGSQIVVENAVTPVNYDPKTTNLSWNLVGDITMKNTNDSTKNIHLIFNLVKTLVNTSTPAVFPISKQAAINWSLAVIEYKGTVYGETSGNVPFKFEVVSEKGLARVFTCSPDKVYGISLGATPSSSVTPGVEEFHPFINGAGSFTTAALYPRIIHYGPEERVENSAAPCDNSGAVTIKGISYPIDFKKVYK